MFLCIEIKSIPENCFCIFNGKRWESIPASSRNKVHLIVTIPVLETMFAAI